jgi:hypothetical protein
MNTDKHRSEAKKYIFSFLTCVYLCSSVANATADAPVFVLYSTRDDQPAGALVRLGTDGTTELAGAAPVPGTDVVSLRRQGLPVPHFPHDRPHALFGNGDRLPGRVIAVTGDNVRFQADLGAPQELTVPLSSLAAVWFTERAAARAATPAGRRLLDEKRRQDLVLLANNDTLQGTVVGLDVDGPLRLDAGGSEVSVPRERLQGLLLNTDLARAARPRGPYRQLVLANGARLSLRTVALEGGALRGTPLVGGRVRVSLADVAAVNTYQGKAVYLSELKPKRYEHTPFLGARWPFAADHSVAGLDLCLAGGTYDRGLGLHSQSRLTYALPAGAKRFEALVGLDEVTGQSGGVRVQVLADGKALLDPAPELGASDPPRALRLDLPKGARELTVAVDFGRGGDVQDHVNWADARVIVGG